MTGTPAEIKDLSQHEDVRQVDVNPNFRVPEIFQTPLESNATVVDGSAWGLAKVLAPEVWGGFGRGSKVRVGHLDTGIDASHPALSGKLDSFSEFDSLGTPVPSAPYDSGSHPGAGFPTRGR